MHKILVLYYHPTDPAAFRDYYVNSHLPLARKLPGLLDMRHSFDVAASGGGASPYFAVWEGDFADAEAMAAALASPEGQAVQADVPNYATGGAVVLHYEIDDAN